MLGGKNAVLVRTIINEHREQSKLGKKPTARPPPEARIHAASPTKKPSIRDMNLLLSDEMANLVDEAFTLRQEIPDDHLQRVWEHFSHGDEFLHDDDLELLIREFLILGREAARKQVARQQKAVRHVSKKQKAARSDTGMIPQLQEGDDGDGGDENQIEWEIKSNCYERFPAVGGRELATQAGRTAVKCSQILARLKRGGGILHPCKQILYPDLDDVSDVQIDQHHFMKNFPSLVYYLSSDTNLDKLCHLAPIRHASSGINLNWQPDSLPVGPVRVKCEFEFGEVEGVPDAEDFNIPENTSLCTFIEHLIQVYPQIEPARDELEIQLVTAESITCVDADSETILYSGVELLMMD